MISRKHKIKKNLEDLKLFKDKVFESKKKLVKYLPHSFVEQFKTDLFGSFFYTFATLTVENIEYYKLNLVIQCENLSYVSNIFIPIKISDFKSCNTVINNKIFKFKNNIYQKETIFEKYIEELIKYILINSELIYNI